MAFALRVWSLSAQSVWWDEAFTWQTTSHGLANFWQMLLTGDRNPPLYFVSVAMWGSVAGWSEFSLRFVSVVWMMIGLAFLFNLARRLYNTSAGLWTLASGGCRAGARRLCSRSAHVCGVLCVDGGHALFCMACSSRLAI